MSGLYPTEWQNYLEILRVFFRLLGLFLIVPGFSHRGIPIHIKILLCLALSLALFPVVEQSLGPFPETLTGLLVAVVFETAVGFLIGFVAYLVFEAVHLGAQFIGYQMGFGTAGLIDPINQSQTSLLVPLCGWIALMIFFMMDLHHSMILLFTQSFELTRHLSLLSFGSEKLYSMLVDTAAGIFTFGVQIAMPITFVTLSINVTLGILSRMLPQMHVLLFSFPITILLGMGTLYLIAPQMFDTFEFILEETTTKVVWVLKTL